MSWILAFLGFAVLIILHEAGHFAAAKKVEMRVERFSLFFPPLIARRTRGETEYAIGAVPLGGYVKITGMNPHEELAPEVAHRAYYRQPVWKRIVVIAAGPFVNIVLAFLILWALFMFANRTEATPVVESVSKECTRAAGSRASVDSITAGMPMKSSRPDRNACTATSLAAFSTQVAVPPASAASRASRRQGKASRSGGSNSSAPTSARSSVRTGTSTRSGWCSA